MLRLDYFFMISFGCSWHQWWLVLQNLLMLPSRSVNCSSWLLIFHHSHTYFLCATNSLYFQLLMLNDHFQCLVLGILLFLVTYPTLRPLTLGYAMRNMLIILVVLWSKSEAIGRYFDLSSTRENFVLLSLTNGLSWQFLMGCKQTKCFWTCIVLGLTKAYYFFFWYWFKN